MSRYYSSASFIKLYDADRNLTRIIDLVKSPGIDGIKNSDIFYYGYIPTNTLLTYNLPVEGFNNSNVIDTLTNLMPTSSRDELLFYSNIFLPQISDDNEVLNSIGSIISIEDGENLYTNIYFICLPEEKFMEVYESSNDPSDPYGITDSNNLNLLLSEQDLGESLEAATLVTIGIGLNGIDSWIYKDPLLQNTSIPIDSFIGKYSSSSYKTKYSSKESLLEEETDSKILEIASGLKIKNRKVISVPTTIVKNSTGIASTSYTDPF